MTSILKLWKKFWFQEVDLFNLQVARFILFFGGSIFFFFIRDTYSASFFETWSPISFYKLLEGPLSNQALDWIRGVWLVFGVLAGLGIFFTYTSVIAFFCALVYLGHEYNFGIVHHSHQLFVMCLGILALSNLTYKDDGAKRSMNYFWPLQLIRAYVVYVLFLNGFEKLWYGGGLHWAHSESFYIRLFSTPYRPFLNLWITKQPLWVSQVVASFGVYVVEILAPLVFFVQRKWLFVLIWSSLHVMVTLVLGYHESFYSQILCYLVFIDWQKFCSQNRFMARITSRIP